MSKGGVIVDVFERIEKTGLILTNRIIGKTISLPDIEELIRLAKLGKQFEKRMKSAGLI